MILGNELFLVSSGYDQHIRFWSSDFQENKCKHSIEIKDSSNPSTINVLEITPNKEFVSFATQNFVKFIDLKTMSSNSVN
jgi:WD40 repeat protein